MNIARTICSLYDRLATPERRETFQRATVVLALVGFAIHLGLVFLVRSSSGETPFDAVGTSYLSALYTPFSFVLFYEVFLLILSIPESTTRSLGRQYKILSLIVIRNVFKDVAGFESIGEIAEELPQFESVALDAGGGLVIFGLVVLFQYVDSKRPKPPRMSAEAKRRLDAFISRKKVIAVALSVLFVTMAVTSLASWVAEAVGVARGTTVPTIDVRKIFYLDLFSVMIFSDAVVLLMSLLLEDRYELVFRNSAFVVSTILLRFSLATKHPYDVALGVATVLFGVLVVWIYNAALRVRARREPVPDAA